MAIIVKLVISVCGGGINRVMAYSLYVHIPFCKHRCHYCDFITFVGYEPLQPAYISALIKELRIASSYVGQDSLHSIYFGGGTPSLLSIYHYKQLIKAIQDFFIVDSNCEISLEANPGTLSYEYLCELRELGINRLSFGVQSTNSFDLIRLDRSHTLEDVVEGFRYARKAGFDNINLDLIFNTPWQDLSSWENSLSRAIALSPEHFSLYSLIIEEGTALDRWYQRGLVACQDEDLEAEMFETAIMMLADAGYFHYEISNWAKKDHKHDYRCIHNLQYWKNLPYLGVGVGAHGYVNNVRIENVHSINDYISRFNDKRNLQLTFPETQATMQTIQVDLQTQMKDFMWLGLRLVDEGVSVQDFFHTYGFSMVEVFDEEITELLNLGLVRWIDDRQHRLILTQRGLMLANQVFMRFV